MIKILLWDIDGTLLDFKAQEENALKECFKLFNLGEKAADLLQIAIGLAAIIIIGLGLIKLILAFFKKTLKKTTLDESMHVFILNAIRKSLTPNLYNSRLFL